MEKKEIKIMLKIKDGFISTNALYQAKVSYSGGHPHAQVYKNPKAVRAEQIIRDQLRAIDFTEYKDWLRHTKHFKLLIQYVIKTNVRRKDSSNLIKHLEDCWTRFVHDDLGIDNYDDSKHLEVHAYKSTIPGLQEDIACIQLVESNASIRFDAIDKPETIKFQIPSTQFECREFKKAMKELDLKYTWSDSKKPLKEYNSEFILLNNPSISNIVDLIDYLETHKDSKYIFVGTNNQELCSKINEFGLFNIKSSEINTWEDIIKLLSL